MIIFIYVIFIPLPVTGMDLPRAVRNKASVQVGVDDPIYKGPRAPRFIPNFAGYPLYIVFLVIVFLTHVIAFWSGTKLGNIAIIVESVIGGVLLFGSIVFDRQQSVVFFEDDEYTIFDQKVVCIIERLGETDFNVTELPVSNIRKVDVDNKNLPLSLGGVNLYIEDNSGDSLTLKSLTEEQAETILGEIL